MNFIDEVPPLIAAKITRQKDVPELKHLRASYRGAKNVWIRLAIDDRIEELK